MTSKVLLRGNPELPQGDYSCSPRMAVLTAYAVKHKGDLGSWDYEAKYGHLVRTGDKIVSCGPFTCRLEEE